ncbi:tripartite tricarboxylate transporter substrate binding protein [Bradyrhizobium sp. LB11.1]|uniref:Bug family tripartite tricarboxylate transporter substrate binding protein n=1 Tax=Bradyrhizobium sp. LB11.1 TaxID=3156326 RepID=UPI003394BEF9
MTQFSRREALAFLSFVACAAGGGAAQAQDYPSKPVKLISPYAPGGATDIIARLIGQWLGDKLKAPFITENRGGGGANIGTEAALRSQADGYTLLLASTANAANATLYPKLRFNFLADSTPVGSIGVVPNVLVVHPDFPAKTLPEFIEVARNKTGAITMGLPGNGSPQHLAAALFGLMSKTEFLFVQYQGGGPVLKDLIGGHIQAAFASSVSSTANIKSGTLRALAVTSSARLSTLPEVPAIGEYVRGYEATNFYGLSAPKGTPPSIVAQLNQELNAALKDDAVIARLETLGIGPVAMSPSAFGEFLVSETNKWSDVIKSADIRME